MKVWKRMLLPVLILLLTVLALAAGPVDLTAPASLTVSVHYGTVPIADMPVQAYLVSVMDAWGELTPTEAFSAYSEQLDIRGRDDAAWQELAVKLADELPASLKPDISGTTDREGNAMFSNVTKGLYLVTGGWANQDGSYYEFSPFFALVPQWDEQTGQWNTQVTAYAKASGHPAQETFEVVKKWDDTCHSTQRPQTITISIYCDDALYDTVTLPHNGKWSYSWTAPANHKWTVRENAVSGYAAPEISRAGNVFTVVNTCNKPGTEELPKTGQLWWPVPVLTCAGLLLVIAGLAVRRRENEK